MQTEVIVFETPGAASLTVRDPMVLGPSQVRIKTNLSLVSAGTERSFLKAPPFLPFFPGYSVAGHVIEAGADVAGFAPGDRVIAHAEHASEVVSDQRFVAKIPDNVPLEDAVFFNLTAVAIHSVRLARIRLGDPVLLIGQGLLGLLAAQVARLNGALPVIGVDIDPKRLDIARSLGVDLALDGRDTAAVDRALADLPGGGAAATVELSAAPGAITRAIALTRRRGRIVAAGIGPGADVTVSLAGEASLKGIEIIGAYFNSRPWRLQATETLPPTTWPLKLDQHIADYNGSDTDTSYGDIKLALRLMAASRLKLAPLVSEVFAPSQASSLFDKILQSEVLAALVRWE